MVRPRIVCPHGRALPRTAVGAARPVRLARGSRSVAPAALARRTGAAEPRRAPAAATASARRESGCPARSRVSTRWRTSISACGRTGCGPPSYPGRSATPRTSGSRSGRPAHPAAVTDTQRLVIRGRRQLHRARARTGPRRRRARRDGAAGAPARHRHLAGLLPRPASAGGTAHPRPRHRGGPAAHVGDAATFRDRGRARGPTRPRRRGAGRRHRDASPCTTSTASSRASSTRVRRTRTARRRPRPAAGARPTTRARPSRRSPATGSARRSRPARRTGRRCSTSSSPLRVTGTLTVARRRRRDRRTGDDDRRRRRAHRRHPDRGRVVHRRVAGTRRPARPGPRTCGRGWTRAPLRRRTGFRTWRAVGGERPVDPTAVRQRRRRRRGRGGVGAGGGVQPLPAGRRPGPATCRRSPTSWPPQRRRGAPSTTATAAGRDRRGRGCAACRRRQRRTAASPTVSVRYVRSFSRSPTLPSHSGMKLVVPSCGPLNSASASAFSSWSVPSIS